MQLQKHLSAKNHPYHKFSTGLPPCYDAYLYHVYDTWYDLDCSIYAFFPTMIDVEIYREASSSWNKTCSFLPKMKKAHHNTTGGVDHSSMRSWHPWNTSCWYLCHYSSWKQHELFSCHVFNASTILLLIARFQSFVYGCPFSFLIFSLKFSFELSILNYFFVLISQKISPLWCYYFFSFWYL